MRCHVSERGWRITYLDLFADCTAHFVEVTFILRLRCKVVFEDFDSLRVSSTKGVKGKDVGPGETMAGNRSEC